MNDAPIQYAPSSDGYLAYQVLGDGPVDLLRIDEVTMTSIDSIADEPHRDHFDKRLASFARVIRFDRRGIGLSDGHSDQAPLTIEQGARDARRGLGRGRIGAGRGVRRADRDGARARRIPNG